MSSGLKVDLTEQEEEQLEGILCFLRFMLNACLGVALIIAIMVGWGAPAGLFFVLIVLSALTVVYNNYLKSIRAYVTGAIICPLVEAFLIYHGAWAYTLPDFGLVPLWLFPAWGIVAVLIRRTDLSWISRKKLN